VRVWFFFFFSSRRRHTRFSRDWSSDVCSSDLAAVIMVAVFAGFVLTHDIMIKQIGFALALGILIDAFFVRMALVPAVMALFGDRSEERRVGKECRGRGGRGAGGKKDEREKAGW